VRTSGSWSGGRAGSTRPDGAEGLTSRDLIKPTFPKWARSIAIGYLGVLGAMTGGFILLMVVFFVVLVVTD
jgi:hypothetical protein